MKKNKTTIIMLLFFFMGLSVLLYPSISNLYNKKFQSRAIVDYESILDTYDETKYEEMLTKAQDYNRKLKRLEDPFSTYNTISNYESVLNIDNSGMMGYLTIEKIKVELPIYHGTSSKILSKAVGHLEGSSLPIGGIGTHSVLSAHRGLPSSTLFTDLDKLEIGDIFTITILNKVLTYEIDNIVIINPDEIDNLLVDENEDYVTLLTCTPYGINTQRLLVRGTRIENSKEKTYITTEAFKINSLIVIPIVAIPIILALLLIIIFKPIENNKKRLEEYLSITKNKSKKKSLEVKNDDKQKN